MTFVIDRELCDEKHDLFRVSFRIFLNAKCLFTLYP
jgi:hypothetical protein